MSKRRWKKVSTSNSIHSEENAGFSESSESMKKKVYICAPLGGDVAENLERVKKYTEYALKCGAAPIVPHFYALCLDDNDPKQRETGMLAGQSLLWFCDEMWIFGDELTDGMKEEIQFCKNMKIRMRKIKNMERR